MDLNGLLYWLVRVLQPRLVVEVGCGEGYTTEALGSAIADAGYGEVITCDMLLDCVRDTLQRCRSLPVTGRACRGVDLPELRMADLLIARSTQEIIMAKPGSVVVDLGVKDAELWAEQRGGVAFRTPAGRSIGLMRKLA